MRELPSPRLVVALRRAPRHATLQRDGAAELTRRLAEGSLSTEDATALGLGDLALASLRRAAADGADGGGAAAAPLELLVRLADDRDALDALLAAGAIEAALPLLESAEPHPHALAHGVALLALSLERDPPTDADGPAARRAAALAALPVFRRVCERRGAAEDEAVPAVVAAVRRLASHPATTRSSTAPACSLLCCSSVLTRRPVAAADAGACADAARRCVR